jgi:hypothetical protein
VNPVYGKWLMRAKTGRDDPVYVFRPLITGKGCIEVQYLGSKAGGWHRYREVSTGHEYNTREWYANTTEIDCLLAFIRRSAKRASNAPNLVERDQHLHVIDNATLRIAEVTRLNNARLCGY